MTKKKTSKTTATKTKKSDPVQAGVTPDLTSEELVALCAVWAGALALVHASVEAGLCAGREEVLAMLDEVLDKTATWSFE